jgi:hypothetical protein
VTKVALPSYSGIENRRGLFLPLWNCCLENMLLMAAIIQHGLCNSAVRIKRSALSRCASVDQTSSPFANSNISVCVVLCISCTFADIDNSSEHGVIFAACQVGCTVPPALVLQYIISPDLLTQYPCQTRVLPTRDFLAS